MDKISLNGEFWTLASLQKKLGLSYFQTYWAIREYKDKFIHVGQTFLIPDDVAEKILQKYPRSKKDSVAVSFLPHKLGCGEQAIQSLINFGLPTFTYDKHKRVTMEVYNILDKIIQEYKEKYGCVPTCFLSECWEKFKEEYGKINPNE